MSFNYWYAWAKMIGCSHVAAIRFALEQIHDRAESHYAR